MQKIYLGLPAYDEEKSIKPLFTRIYKLQASLPMPLVVIVYDDGCRDGTKKEVLAWTPLIEIIYLDGVVNKGLGSGMNALLSEFAKRGGREDVLVVMDCDNTHDPAQIPQMLDVLKDQPETDLVIASRYRSGATITGVPFHRIFLSVGAAVLYKLVHPIFHVRDYTCGYRVYRHGIIMDALSKFDPPLLKEKGFACMVELLLKLNKSNARMREIPLMLAYDNKLSVSEMDVFGNSFQLLKKLLAWRFWDMK
ncbi:MAG TPA: glycosyltransferase [Gammaproteobacteria bacterium]|nr:glycosyltransferase [Gammaproteobacteria bacterium]